MRRTKDFGKRWGSGHRARDEGPRGGGVERHRYALCVLAAKEREEPERRFGASRNCEVTFRLETTSPRRKLLAILCPVTTWGFLDVYQKISRGSIVTTTRGISLLILNHEEPKFCDCSRGIFFLLDISSL